MSVPRSSSGGIRPFLASLALALVAAPGAAQGPPPDGLVDVFRGRLGKDALARDVNAAGQLAGSFWTRDGYHAFVTLGRRVLDLGPGDAHAINDRGQVVGSTSAFGGSHAFLFDADGLRLLGEPAGGTSSIAHDVNELGQVVGQWQGPDVPGVRPFLWDEAGGMRDLRTLGGDYARALGINDAGQIVGESWTETDIDHPFLLDEAGMHDLRPVIAAASGPGWTTSSAHEIDERGRIIGMMYPSGGGHGTAYSFDLVTQEFVALEPLVPGEFSYPSDINAAGQIVGWARPPAGVGTGLVHAVLWEDGVVRDLGTLGGAASFAMAITEAGLIAGTADTRSGARHVFVLDTR